jgi:predicted permease
LPFADPDRVVHLYEASEPAAKAGNRLVVRPGSYYDWRAKAHSFSSMGAVAPRYAALAGDGPARLLWTHRITEALFETLGVAPSTGRTFEHAEFEAPGGAPVVVLAHHLWLRVFGGASDIIGRTLMIDNRSHTVIGVVPPGFYPSMFGRVDAWLPLYIEPGKRASRVDWLLQPVARLRPGVTLEQARADLDAVARRVAAAFPIDGRPLTGATIPAEEVILGPQRPLFMILLAASALLLVIAGVNVTALFVVHGVDQTRELAVRTALGAPRWRLVRQSLLESMLLAGAGALLGILCAAAVTPAVLALLPETALVPRIEQVEVDGDAAVFAIGLATVLGAAIGFVPASITLRSLSFHRGLGRSGRSTTADRRGRRAQAALIVTQVAASIVLLLAAAVVLRSFVRLRKIDPGIRTSNVVTMQLRAPESRYSSEPSQWALFEAVESRLRALPGVVAVGLGAGAPVRTGVQSLELHEAGPDAGRCDGAWATCIDPTGQPRLFCRPWHAGRCRPSSQRDRCRQPTPGHGH